MMGGESVGLKHMLRDELANDRYGIAWTVLPQAAGIEGVKPIAMVRWRRPRSRPRAVNACAARSLQSSGFCSAHPGPGSRVG